MKTLTSFVFITSLAVSSFFPSTHASDAGTMIYRNDIRRVAVSNNTNLFTPTTEIVDGGIYIIRNAENQDLCLDVCNGNAILGNNIEVYQRNGTAAQSFIVKKQFNYDNVDTYRISPLYGFDYFLRFGGDGDGETLKVDSEKYSQFDLFADKFEFIRSNGTEFIIKTGASFFSQSLVAGDGDTPLTNNLIKQKQVESSSFQKYRWQFLKTNNIGIDVKNLVSINGQVNQRFNINAPMKGRFCVETQSYSPSYNVDTYLSLYRTSDNALVASNDDEYSLGYVGSIYDNTCNVFPKKFFEALETRSIEDAVSTATEWTKGDNWWYWTFFGALNDDICNPVLYKKGDVLKSSCGNGNYDGDSKKSKAVIESSSNSLTNDSIVLAESLGLYCSDGFITNSLTPVDIFENDVSTKSRRLSGNSTGSKLFKFASVTDQGVVLVGFSVNEQEGRADYYNLTTNVKIAASDFEATMGNGSALINGK